MSSTQFLDPSSSTVATLSGGVLIARLVFGLGMSAHGVAKLSHWFGGYGLTGTGQFFEQLGFRPGRAFAAVAASTEVVAGLLIALGFLGPVGPALVLAVMIVALITVHLGNGLFAATNGIEVPLLYATAAVMLALTGPGRFSLDTVLGLDALWSPALTAVALGVGVIGGLGNLTLRRRALSDSDAGVRTT